MVTPNVTRYKERVERYTAAGFWRPETLDLVLDTVVDTYSDKIAVMAPYGSMSYRELRKQADRVAAQLSNRSIGRGDVISFLKDHGFATQKLPERLEVMREFPLTPQ